jgi:hypothetical protein
MQQTSFPSAAPRVRRMPRLATLPLALTAAGALLFATAADARITRIQITTSESPTFGGYSWPGVGQYQKIAGKAFGEVNPNDPKNAVIVDVGLAPRNARGNVEYSFDFYILKPIDLKKGAHKVMYEPPNRGGKTWTALARVNGGGNDPGSITDPDVLANSFLMPRGYTMVWSGWDKSAGTSSANFNTTITLPVAKNPDGSSITGPNYEYIVTGGATYTLSYAAATLDKTKAKLTHRVHLDDVPVEIPASGWNYNAAGTHDQPGRRQLRQQRHLRVQLHGQEPTVNGLGFAAVRDWNSWLRSATVDDFGTANPACRRHPAHLHRDLLAARTLPERLPPPRLQPGRGRQEGVRRIDASGSRRAAAST